MLSPYCLVDASGSYLANIILKNGRNEVQIYHFSTSASSLIDYSKTNRYETDHAITCATWFNDTAVLRYLRRDPKRKADAEEPNMGDSLSPSILLAVAFSSGQVFVYSPGSDSAVATVLTPSIVIALSRASTASCFWALTDTQAIIEIEAFTGTVNRTVRFAKIDKDVRLLVFTSYRGRKSDRSSFDPEMLLLASSKVFLVDGFKGRKQLVAEFADDDECSSRVSVLSVLLSDDLSVIMARENTNTVALYDLDDPTRKPTTWDCKSRHINRIRSLTETLIAVFTDLGTEILSLRDDALDGCTAVIRTSHKQIAFADMVYSELHGVVGIWYDGNEPRFVRVAAEASFEGELKVDIEYQSTTEENAEEDASEITFIADIDDGDYVDYVDEGNEVNRNGHYTNKNNNILPEELFTLLRDLLLLKEKARKYILTLCSRNCQEETIKDTVRFFSQSEQCVTMVLNLFQIISHEVSRDPTRKSPLSLWLRWILLAHGGYISKQPEQGENLRALKDSLELGMEMMPKLLALQGRLHLLKSQADLRSQTSHHSLEDDEDDDFNGAGQDFGNDTANSTTVFEDLVMYANGENDDFESDAFRGTVVYENGEGD